MSISRPFLATSAALAVSVMLLGAPVSSRAVDLSRTSHAPADLSQTLNALEKIAGHLHAAQYSSCDGSHTEELEWAKTGFTALHRKADRNGFFDLVVALVSGGQFLSNQSAFGRGRPGYAKPANWPAAASRIKAHTAGECVTAYTWIKVQGRRIKLSAEFVPWQLRRGLSLRLRPEGSKHVLKATWADMAASHIARVVAKTRQEQGRKIP